LTKELVFAKITLIRGKLNLLLNYLIIAYAFVIPFQYYITKQFVEILFVLWIFTVNYKDVLSAIKINRVFQLVLALSALIFLSYLWSGSYPNTVYGDFNIFSKTYSIYFLIPIIIIVTVLKAKYIPWLINSFLFSMFINTIVSYGIFFELWSTVGFLSSPSNPIPFQISHITYSVFVAFTILLTIYKLISENNKYIKFLYLIFFIVLTINLFMSSGRTGQLSLILSLLTIMIVYNRMDLKKILISLFLIIGVLFFAYKNINTFNARINYSVEDINTLLFSKNKKDSSIGDRVLAFHAFSYIVEPKYLLFGVGMGEKENYIMTRLEETKYPYKIKNFFNYGRLHNMFLEIIISNGIVGLFLLLMLFYYIFSMFLNDKQVKFIAYSISSIFFFVAIPGDIFFFYEFMLLFGLFLSIVVVQYNFEQNEQVN